MSMGVILECAHGIYDTWYLVQAYLVHTVCIRTQEIHKLCESTYISLFQLIIFVYEYV